MAGSAPRTIIVFSIVFPTVSNSCTDTGKKKIQCRYTMEISESLFSWKQYCEFDISSIFLMIVIPKWKKKKRNKLHFSPPLLLLLRTLSAMHLSPKHNLLLNIQKFIQIVLCGDSINSIDCGANGVYQKSI